MHNTSENTPRPHLQHLLPPLPRPRLPPPLPPRLRLFLPIPKNTPIYPTPTPTVQITYQPTARVETRLLTLRIRLHPLNGTKRRGR